MSIKHLLLASLSLAALNANASSQTLQTKLTDTIENAKFNFSMVGTNLESVNNKSSVINTSIGLEGSFNVAEGLKANFNGELNFGTGSSNSVYENNRVTAYDGTRLRDAYLSYKYQDFISLKAGAINQGIQQAPLVVGKKSFLAINEEIKFSISEVDVFAGATQAKPKSEANKDGIGKIEDGSPLFAREYVAVRSQRDDLTLEATVGHFAYDKLSTDAAYNSQFYGNSVFGQSKSNAEFNYSFVGWDMSVMADFHLTRNLDLHLGVHQSINNGAPTGQNRGQILIVGTKYTKENWETEISFNAIKVESDAAPSIYLNKAHEGNYESNLTSLSFKNIANDLTIKVKYLNATPINNNFYQDKQEIIEIELRKGYEIF